MKRGNDVIVYNGEIYNFLELRHELISLGYIFESSGDTEVLVYAFQEWGLDATKKFKGMFAFILWSELTRQIIAVRDHLGIKPLYYSILEDGSFVAASEYKAFYQFKQFSPELNSSLLSEFFQYRSVYGRNTLIRQISQVKPGEILTYSQVDKSISFSQFWSSRDISQRRDITDTGNEIHRMISESVRSHLISDVPVGTQFSGGIDSSLVSAIAQKEYGSHLTGYYCRVDDAEFDETFYAEKIAAELSIPLETVTLSSDIFFSSLFDELTWHMDDPINHPNSIGIYLISKLAKNHVKVLLSGESADELFGGYDWYKFMVYYNILNKFPAASLAVTSIAAKAGWRFDRIHELNTWAHSTAREEVIAFSSRFLDPATVSRFLKTENIHAGSEKRLSLSRSLLEQTDMFSAMHIYDIETYLPPLYMRQDRMSMAASIENRVPFALPEIVQSALRLPRDQKISFFDQKKILKKYLMQFIPRSLVYRRKWGFAIPLRKWLESMNAIERIREIVDGRFPSSEYFDLESIRTIADRKNKSATDIQVIWSLISYSSWARIFLDKNKSQRYFPEN
jgi:asparagine synthase (glutamine-hydrolysing)